MRGSLPERKSNRFIECPIGRSAPKIERRVGARLIEESFGLVRGLFSQVALLVLRSLCGDKASICSTDFNPS
jgi:hypothetical protein